MNDTAELNRRASQARTVKAARLKSQDNLASSTPALTEKDLLRLHRVWQSSLDPQMLLASFESELQQWVPHDSIQFQCSEIDTRYQSGRTSRHCANYQLTLEQRSLGAVELSRGKRFCEQELLCFERLLGSFVPSLRNSVDYQLALQSAYTDCLTGIYNRTAMAHLFPKEMQRAQRNKQPLSALVIDIDNFKAINDQYGHRVGDQVIETVAKQIVGNIRRTDSAFRHGGEEFLVLLPDASVENAQAVGEKIRTAVEKIRFTTNDSALQATVSVGASLCDSDNMESATHKADQAMYQAKLAGKNCVKAWR